MQTIIHFASPTLGYPDGRLPESLPNAHTDIYVAIVYASVNESRHGRERNVEMRDVGSLTLAVMGAESAVQLFNVCANARCSAAPMRWFRCDGIPHRNHIHRHAHGTRRI